MKTNGLMPSRITGIGKFLTILLVLFFAIRICGICEAREYPVKQYKLDNGLTVILKPIPDSPAVSVCVVYRAGTVWEKPGESGISHILEHLLYRGTKHYPGTKMARTLNRLGADFNAFTSNDVTGYYTTISPQYLELVFDMEADRMSNAEFAAKDIDVEKRVLFSEASGAKNDPSFILWEKVLASALEGQPYGRTPYGNPDEIGKLTKQNIEDFYKSHYMPKNAVISVVGRFNQADVEKLISKYFNERENGKTPIVFRDVTENQQKEEKIVEVRDIGLTSLLHVAYHTPSIKDKDLYTIALIDSILTGGRSSRLRRALVETGITASSAAWLDTGSEPGLYYLRFALRPGVTHQKAEEVLNREIARLTTEEVSAAELQKAKNQLKAQFINAGDGVTRQARNLGWYEGIYTYNYVDSFPSNIDGITAADIKNAASRFFVKENRTIGRLYSKSANQPFVVPDDDKTTPGDESFNFTPSKYLSGITPVFKYGIANLKQAVGLFTQNTVDLSEEDLSSVLDYNPMLAMAQGKAKAKAKPASKPKPKKKTTAKSSKSSGKSKAKPKPKPKPKPKSASKAKAKPASKPKPKPKKPAKPQAAKKKPQAKKKPVPKKKPVSKKPAAQKKKPVAKKPAAKTYTAPAPKNVSSPTVKKPASYTGSKVPSIPAPQEFSLVTKKRTLDNGVALQVYENKVNPSVVIRVEIGAGGMFEPAGKEGLSKITAYMIQRGSENLTGARLSDELDYIGADMTTNSSLQNTELIVKTVPEQLDRVVPLIASVIRKPVFPEDQLSALKSLMQARLNAIKDRPSIISMKDFFGEVFPADHPFHHFRWGTKESIASITRNDLVEFHKTYYRPDSTIIAVSGDVDSEKVIQLFNKELGTWKADGEKTATLLPQAALPDSTVKKVNNIPDKQQVDIVMGHRGIPRNHPHFYKFELMNHILGSAPSVNRLERALRGAGMAYRVFSRLNVSVGEGPWAVQMSVEPKNVDKALGKVVEQMKSLQTQPVGEDEFLDAKYSLMGGLPVFLENNENIARELASIEYYKLGDDYFKKYYEAYNSITRKDIQDTAKTYLYPDKMFVIISGPVKE